MAVDQNIFYALGNLVDIAGTNSFKMSITFVFDVSNYNNSVNQKKKHQLN